MKKQLLIILSFACVGFNTNAQNYLLPKFLAKTNHFTINQNGAMFKSGTFYKPGKQINYVWDTVISAWIPQDTIVFTYNNYSNVTLRLDYIDDHQYPYKIVYGYNTSGEKLATDTSFYFEYVWSSYMPRYIENFSYDAKGNNTQVLHLENDFDGKTNYTYDANNNITKYLSYTGWTGFGWVNGIKTDYTWSNGQLTGEITQRYDSTTTTWTEDVKTDYSYLASKCNGITIYNWNGTTWKRNANYININWYNWAGDVKDSKISSYTYQVPNDTGWKDTMTDTYTYDSYGNQTDHLTKAKPAAVWLVSGEQKDIYLYDYNANNSISQVIDQTWINSTIGLRNNYKIVYSNYQAFTSTGISQINSGKNDFVVYPNPSTGMLFINNESEENFATKVMDMNGKLIDEFLMNAKTEKQMNYGNLSQGIYLIQLISNDKVMQRKIVITR